MEKTFVELILGRRDEKAEERWQSYLDLVIRQDSRQSLIHDRIQVVTKEKK